MVGATYRFSFAHRSGLAGGLIDSNAVRFSLGNGAPVDLTESYETWAEVAQDFVADGTTTLISLFFEQEEAGVLTFAFVDSVSFLFIAPPAPTSDEELAALLTAAVGAARLVVLDAQGVARDVGQASIVARSKQLGLGLDEATDGDAVVVSSKSGTPGLVGNVYSWAQITGFDSAADSGPGSITGTGFQLGADVAVGSDLVAGLSFGRSEIAASDTDLSQEGTLTYLQPYFAYQAGTWHGNASLIFGRGDYDQTSLGGDGSGESELFAITFEGGRDFALGERAMITPTLGLIHGREEVTGISGTLAGAGTETYDFNQMSLGARVTVQGNSGRYFVGAFADYLDQDAGTTVLADDFLSENGWSGRIELGGSTDLGQGLGLSTSVDISGLGGTAQTVSGGLRFALTF